MQGFGAFLKSLGAARIVAMGAVTVVLMGFFAFLILRVTAPQMTTLFTDLTFEDSAAIVKDLERQAIPYELKNDGAILLVPRDRVARLRMKLAEAGLPKGGGIGCSGTPSGTAVPMVAGTLPETFGTVRSLTISLIT